MRIDMSIAVSREMLGRRQHVLRLHPAHERGHEAADLGRILAEAPRVDDRIISVDVDVGDRREDVVHPHQPRFPRHHPPLLLGKRRIAGRCQRHRPRPVSRVEKAHPHPRLEIGADEKRHARSALQSRTELRRLVNIRDRPDHAADMALANVTQQLLVRPRRLGHEHAAALHHEHLPDLFIERELFDRRNRGGVMLRNRRTHRGQKA